MIPEDNACSVGQFHCANGRCIPLTWVCDNADDCHDNTDESSSLCKGE